MKTGVRLATDWEVRWNGYDRGFCLSFENEHTDPNQSPPETLIEGKLWIRISYHSLRNVQWRCFVLALLASAFLSHVLIKFSYLFAVFFLWMFFVHFLLFMFVCFKKVDFFLLQINICRSYNLICLLMYLDCIVLFKFIWVHFILSYFYLAFQFYFIYFFLKLRLNFYSLFRQIDSTWFFYW